MSFISPQFSAAGFVKYIAPGDTPRFVWDTSNEDSITHGLGSGVAGIDGLAADRIELTQSLTDNQPETGVATINGRNAFKYSRANHHYLTGGSIFGDRDAYTIFIVCSVTEAINDRTLLSKVDLVYPSDRGLTVTLNGIARNVVLLFKSAAGLQIVGTPAGSITVGVPFLLTVRLSKNSAQSLIRINGITLFSGFIWDPIRLTGDFLIGTLFTVTNNGDFEGLIGPIRIYEGLLNNQKMINVEQQLKTLWMA